jgi:hypothetical protein
MVDGGKFHYSVSALAIASDEEKSLSRTSARTRTQHDKEQELLAPHGLIADGFALNGGGPSAAQEPLQTGEYRGRD